MIQPDCRLILVRHGHSTGNRPWHFLGHTDAPLSRDGMAQAAQLGQQLAEQQIDQIYCSPLQRARQTAAAVAAHHALTPLIDQRLIEQDFGAWEGRSLAEVSDRYPADLAAWQQNARQHPPTGGERLNDLAARARQIVKQIRQQHQGETVLIVSHGGISNGLLCTLLHTRLQWRWAYALETGGWCRVDLFGKTAVLTHLNSG